MNNSCSTPGKALNWLWRLVSRHPGAIIIGGLLLALAGGLFASLYLRLNSNQDILVSPKVPFQKRYLEVLRNFGDQEYLFVVIHADLTPSGKEDAKRFADHLARRLREHPKQIQAVYYRISAADLGPGALFFTSLEEAKDLSRTVVSLAPSLNAWLDDGSLVDLLKRLDTSLRGGGDASPLPPEMAGPALRGMEEFLGNIENSLQGKSPETVLPNLSKLDSRYFFTRNDQFLILRILPSKDFESLDVIGKPLATVRQALENTRAEFPGVEVGLTGRPVLQADEMQTTNRDMTRASIIAFILVGLLFVAVLHGWLRPVLIMASLGLAMAWTFGFATIAPGELNLLSIVFALVLVGIGVDFGVHIVTRFAEERKSGLDVSQAVRTALFTTGPGIILGALTSVCAFYSVLGSDFKGLAELGLIGGTGILLCLLAMMTVLPALVLKAGDKKLFPLYPRPLISLPFLERVTSRPRLLIFLLAGVTILALPGLTRVRFNFNLLKLQARGLESVKYEHLLIDSTDESTWYAVFTVDSLDQVLHLRQKLLKFPSVGRVESIEDYLPSNQKRKAVIFEKAARALDVPNSPADPPPPSAASLSPVLEQLSETLEGLEEKVFTAGGGSEVAIIEQCLGHLENSLDLLKQDPDRAGRLAGFQDQLVAEVVQDLRQLKTWLTAKPVTPDDLPPMLQNIFVGKDGRYQIKVTPSQNVWDFAKLTRFVEDLRQVDPLVSGVPIGVLESARLMRRTFLSAAGFTLLLVSAILALYSRSVRYVLLALLPLGIGMLWLLELMGWFGWNFNLANFFAIPILIAIGVDGGVHFLARWKEIEGHSGLFSTSTPTAVALSFTTTMIGFGGLLFAHHRGLASLGVLMVVGSLTTMLACLLVLPSVLKVIGKTGRGD
jgi:hopanoid biosynthesis associated RND transporter like protein HpnN